MGIFNRIGRLWKADLHGIIDSLEEPRAILKQALRDMQEEIESTTAHLEACKSEEERLAAEPWEAAKEIGAAQHEVVARASFSR